MTAPQTHANNREIPDVQMRVSGGGSSINAEVFMRGHPSDCDRWAQEEGADDWAFDDIQRYFLRSEGNSILSDGWHGTSVPLAVSNNPDPSLMTRVCVQSCQERGIPDNPDFNGPVQAGSGIYQTTTRKNHRCGLFAPGFGPP